LICTVVLREEQGDRDVVVAVLREQRLQRLVVVFVDQRLDRVRLLPETRIREAERREVAEITRADAELDSALRQLGRDRQVSEEARILNEGRSGLVRHRRPESPAHAVHEAKEHLADTLLVEVGRALGMKGIVDAMQESAEFVFRSHYGNARSGSIAAP